MTAAIRCLCARCVGNVIFTRVSDYLAAHPEVVIEEPDVEIEVAASQKRHPSNRHRVAWDQLALPLEDS